MPQFISAASAQLRSRRLPSHVAGSGCWFTFGRANWWMTAGAPKPGKFLCVPKTDGDTPGKHTFDMTFNFEPSRRLRFYQFDPWHHELAIWSVH